MIGGLAISSSWSVLKAADVLGAEWGEVEGLAKGDGHVAIESPRDLFDTIEGCVCICRS